MIYALTAALLLGGCGAKGNESKPAAAETAAAETAVKETAADKKEDAPESKETAGQKEGTAADKKEETGAKNEQDASSGEENIGEFWAKAENGVIDLPSFGMKIKLPDSMKNGSDEIAAYGFVDMNFGYAAVFMIDENDAENRCMELTEIYGYREKQDLSTFSDTETGLTGDVMLDLGDNGTLYYAGLKMDEVYKKNPGIVEDLVETVSSEEQKKRYLEMISASEEMLKGIELTPLKLPDPPKAPEISGSEIMDIEVFDLDQKPMKLGSMISGNKVTMLNYWGTFCGPCIKEMPFLGELERKYKDQGFEILGITLDIVDESGKVDEGLIEEAEEIMSVTGVTYPIIIASKELRDYNQLTVVPTTYFVDAQGNMVRDPVIGSQTQESWEKIITELLEKQ
ncbi:MAG: TlpA family protein disulfide reductase [Stomatobaculum sp.]|nr:TlpA family protein disulfide reductase [Stomatobaculum sp.]